MKRLNDKVVVVTGGSGLIGSAIIKYLIKEGAIALNAELNVIDNFSKGEFNCDITDSDSISNLTRTIIDKYSRIDGWVNNAYPRTLDWGNKFEIVTAESWSKNIDYQLNSLFFSSQLVLEIMKKQGYGSVVNIASIYGSVAPDFNIYNGTDITMPAAYSAIKGATINFSKYLASYYGPYGVRVNSVSPGGIFNNQDPIFVNNYEERVPLRRMGNPKDVAPAVGFLLSDEGSYITGQNIIIDGGWTAI
jgi:NAD(P)-dependent dehydrogenase (short-subunit alcohol dehydrogenase family)